MLLKISISIQGRIEHIVVLFYSNRYLVNFLNHDFIHVVVLEGFGTEIWFYTSNGMLDGCLHYGSIAPITFNLDCCLHKIEQINL